MKSSTFLHFLFPSFFLVILLPYFGSLDIIAPQWLYLSLINLIVFVVLPSPIIPKSKFFYLLIFFVIQSLISLLYSNNINLSIVDLSRIFITFFTIINLFSFFKKANFSFLFVSKILSLILLIEVAYSLIPFFAFLLLNDFSSYSEFYQVYSPNSFLGFAGNKNITAASICIKLPFLIYLFYRSSMISKLFYIILFFSSFLLIFLLRARASYISLGFIVLLFTFYFLFSKKYFSYIIFPIILCITFLIVNFLTSNEDTNLVSDISSISFTAESSNQRFFIWENAFSYIQNNPLIGSGIGNWKIESLPYWKTHLNDYNVPYHAHNDFIELATEIGLIGGLTYLSLFIFSFYFLIKLFLLNRLNFDKSFVIITIFLSFSVYFIDAFLNFPLERPRMQIILCLLFTYILLFEKKIIR